MKKHITYQVDTTCFLLTKNFINKSFTEISNDINNILTFEEVEKNGDINIICHSGGYDSSIAVGDSLNSYNNESYINGSKINLYGAVGLAAIEHEIIHSLGISQHNVFGNSIMSSTEYLDEKQALDKDKDNDIISTLIEMYGN